MLRIIPESGREGGRDRVFLHKSWLAIVGEVKYAALSWEWETEKWIEWEW